MNEALVEEIRATAISLAEGKDEIRKLLRELEDPDGGRFPFDQALSSSDYTVEDIFAGLSSLLSLVASINVTENAPFVPKTLLSALNTSLSGIKGNFDSLRNLIATIAGNGGVKKIDFQNLTVTTRNDNSHSFSKPFRGLFANLDAAYAAWYQVRFVLGAPRLAEFSKYVSEFEASREQVSEAVKIVDHTREGVEQRRADIEALYVAAQSTLDELHRTGQEGQTDRKSISEYAAEATNRLAEVKGAEEKAAALQATVLSYQTQFETFDRELAARNQRFTDETTELGVIHDRLQAQENTMKRLTDESETLLRGATNVGLASSFSKLQQQITTELNWARGGFYLSIFFLVVLSLPIALYVFPALQVVLKSLGMNAEFMLPKGGIDSHGTPEILAQIAARALLLVPGIWLVRFASARHERLFRLREHYAYKFSVASSVEGFKKQAPDLEQGIAAAAFYELTFNPATRMDVNSSEARYPNPAMEWIMKKLGGSSEK